MDQTSNKTNSNAAIFETLVLIAAFLVLPSAASASVIAKTPNNLGLVGYWSFNEGTSTIAHDFSGRGNTGTLSGTTIPSWTSGKLGMALSFNTGYVNVPSLTWTPTTFTVSWWLDPADCTSYDQQMLAVNAWGAFAFHTTNSCQVYTGTDVGTRFTPTDLPAGTITLNQWQYFTYTYDGTQGRFYKNGMLLAGPRNQNSPTAWGGLWIGNSTAGSSINGKADEVRVYNRALSAAEILGLYKVGATKVSGNATGLVGYWPLDGGSGAVAKDVSGRGNDGTLVNGPTYAAGKLGNSLFLGGIATQQYINVPTSASLRVGTTSSYAAWVKIVTPDVTQPYYCAYTIVDKTRWNASPATGYNFSIDKTSGHFYLNFSVQNGTTYNVVSNTTSLADGKWHFVSATADGSNLKLYVDGAFSNSAAQTIAPGYGWDYSIFIGAEHLNTATTGPHDYCYFYGNIDDVRIYNRALSAAEVLSLYNSRAGGVQTVNASSQNLTNGSSLASGLVGLWTFDGKDLTDKVYDRSGQGNNSYFIGAATSSAKTIGKLGQALKLNGSTSYVAGPAPSEPTGAATIAAWVKLSAYTPWASILDRYGNENLDCLSLGFDSSAGTNLMFMWNNAAPYNNKVTGNSVIPLNQWVQVAASSNGSNVTFYVNGVPDGTATVGAPCTTGPFELGVNFPGGDEYLNGTMDDVRIYNRALSAAEVKQLYNLGK